METLFNVTRKDGKTYRYDIKDTGKRLSIASIREKEIIHGWKALDKLSGRVKIDVRVYIGRSLRASRHHAIVWLHGDEGYCGIGTADGYNYDKRHASICHALADMGVAYDVREIADSGDIHRALEVMYKDIFNDECFIVEFHA